MANKIYVGISGGSYYYRGLPSGYTQVDYIESDCTAPISTGFIAHGGATVTADFQVVEKTYGFETVIFSHWSDYCKIRAIVTTDNQFQTTYNSSTYATFSQTSDIYARTVVTSSSIDGYGGYGDGTIKIFNQDSGNNRNGTVRLYSLKIYAWGELAVDLVPCKQNSTNKLGLYDMVNNIFCTGSSVPSGYERVKYITSNGTQYINTGYTAVNSTGFAIKFTPMNVVGTSDYGSIFGASASSNNYNQAYYMETWTNDTKKGVFKRHTTTYDPLIERNYTLNIGHSAVTNTLERNDKTRVTINSTSYTSYGPQFLFSQNRGGAAVDKATMSLYLMRYYEGNSVVREYIPCVRISDDVSGLYETIQGQFYTDEHGDAFIVGYQFKNNMRLADYSYGNVVSGPDAAREVKHVYVGTSGIAKQVSKAYIGVNGVAQLIFRDDVVIPYEYQQVEYIEGTGTQYINTGIALDVDYMAIEITAAITSNEYSADSVVMGCYGGSTQRLYVMVKGGSDSAKRKIRLGIGKGYFTDSAKVDTNRHTWMVDMKNLKAYIDGTSKAKNSSSAYSKGTNSNAVIGILCGTNENGEWSYAPTKAKVYNAKIYRSDSLIHDYYPCFRKADNVIGFYDKMAKEFVTNAGTGTFGKGSNYVGELWFT